MPPTCAETKDTEYKNWLKVNLALQHLTGGLHSFIQGEVDAMHQSLLLKLYGSSTVPKPKCPYCKSKDVRQKRQSYMWKFPYPCPSNLCDVWLMELLTLHRNPTSNKISCENCDVTAWPFVPWECAKLYMPRGQPLANTGPAQSNLQALLSLMANCTFFHEKLSPSGQKQIHTLSTIWNNMMHSWNMKLSDSDRKRFVEIMIGLLEDPTYLVSLEECKQAVIDIKKIKDDSVEIVLSIDKEIKEEKASISGARDKVLVENMESDVQEEEEMLESIRNNEQKVQEMIRNRQIPKQRIMEAAVKQDGYSKGVQFTLREMSKLLGREIRQAVGAWCGYKPKDPHTPVFVVTLRNRECVLKKDEIPEPYIDYSINIQYQYVPNDEERNIVEQYGNKSMRSEDVARLNHCIATHTKRLMQEHSNLSIIRPCPVKSRGYLRKEMDVIEKMCIVFYVPVKGIIPVGEEEFPKEIDGIDTDVREGEFYLFGGHDAMEYHKKLRMGCCITGAMAGTLGGFVDLPGEKVGCLTSAHVVLTDDQIKSYVNMVEEDKKKLNDSLAQGNNPIEIHQPTPYPGGKSFGRVQAIALDAGNIFSPSVDAAVIQITDDERKPDMGNFPDGDFENVGFTMEDPMLYTSGNILDDIEPRQRGSLVIKFGYKTGITRGFMEWLSGSVRPVDAWGNFCFPVMMGQFEVTTNNFAQKGDSGALVFLCSGGNIRNLNVIGMIVGGSTTGLQCFITPIQAVFEKLGLERFKFKVFPPKQLSQLETTSQPHIGHISTEQLIVIEQNMKGSMNEHLMRVEQNISENVNERVLSVEQNMNSKMNERFLSFEQKISENLNDRFLSVEHNIGENINQRFMVIEQNISERLTRAEQRTENSFNRIEELLKDLKGKP